MCAVCEEVGKGEEREGVPHCGRTDGCSPSPWVRLLTEDTLLLSL